MLTVVIAGTGRCITADGEQEVRGGMVGLAAGHARGVLMSDPADPYIHYYSRFSGDYARSLADSIVRRRGARWFAVADALALGERLHRHGRIARHALPRRCGPEGTTVLSILEGILDHDDSGAGRGPTADPVARLATYLVDHVAEPSDLDRIAAALDVSRSTVARWARRSGSTVQRLHEAIKMEWAATLLASTRESVAEVARRVGYSDQFYFSRVFRRRYGCPPRSFRSAGRE